MRNLLTLFTHMPKHEDPSRTNNRIESKGTHSIFVDLPGAIGEALEGDLIETLAESKESSGQ